MTATDFARLREHAIRDTFGGPLIYALVKERNPQIDLILNAGIAAVIAHGALQRERDRV